MEATTFAAIGQPTRLGIVELLREGPLSVGEVVDALGIRQPQASKHLRVLDAAGIVANEPVARHRIYRLRGEPFARISDWAGSFERVWELRLDSLGTYLDSTETKEHDDE